MTIAVLALAIAAANIHGLGLTDVLIVAGILAYLLDRLADARGWSRTSKTLRRENEDLIRRNGELEADVERLGAKVDELKTDVARLTATVRELRRTDQAAVLAALKQHEVGATARHRENQQLLGRAVQALEGGT